MWVTTLHKRKLERFANDPEVYQLYRRVVDERSGLIHDYAARMTRLVAMILADGVRKKEYKIDDIGAAAEVVRDAVTVYVHPAHVEAAHDLEDFYRAGRIPLHLLANRRYETERREFFEGAFKRHPMKEAEWSDHQALEEAFNQVIVGLFPLERAYTGTWQERAKLRDFTSQLIGRYVGATKLSPDGSHTVLEIDPDRKLEVAMLKELTWFYVIEVPALATQQEGQREVIKTLFNFYSEASEGKRSKNIFTPFYRQALDDAADRKEKKRVIIDLIAGMTEAQALEMSNRLLGVAGGFGLEELIT